MLIYLKKDSTETTGDELFYHIGTRTESGGLRFCLKCSKYKPDRSHHCKTCNKCILKMDHHCPWVGNCIGFKNYKFFVNLVFWGFINSMFFNYIFRDVVKFLVVEEKVVTVKLIAFIVFFFFMIMLMVGLLIFNIFHFIAVLNNMTTNEFLNINKKRERGEGYDKDGRELNKYDLGIMKNIKENLGWNPILWLIPYDTTNTKSQWNNGYNFKHNIKNEYEIIKSV